MMIRLTMEEFTQLAFLKMEDKHPDLSLVNPPRFMKNHYDGGIEEAYGVPDFVDFEVAD